MRIKVEITEERLKLIKGLRVQKFSDNQIGIDNYDMFLGTYLFQSMALILGYQDKVIDGTQEDYDGPKYEDEIHNHLYDLAEWLVDNLLNIEEILHQFCDVGIKVGTYICQDYERIWEFKEK